MGHGNGDVTEREERLGEIIAAYLEAVEAGQDPDRQVILAAHPELVDELAEFFAGHDRFSRLALPIWPPTSRLRFEEPDSPPVPDGDGDVASATRPILQLGILGDYHILREI